jgi:hypothetical protein
VWAEQLIPAVVDSQPTEADEGAGARPDGTAGASGMRPMCDSSFVLFQLIV